MKRRILSLVLALAMCFTVLSTVAIAEDSELMGVGDTVRLYTDRVWDWQEAQFDAMTDEQKDVIENAYANFDWETIKGIAYATAEEILGENDTFFETETMKDLYKWKLMRDMMEGRIEVTGDDSFDAWLDDFTAFEQANDEAIKPSYPSQALDGLGAYSAELTAYFGELAELVENGLVLDGADSAKANAYINAFLAGDDITAVRDLLEEDVYELIAEGSANGFELVIKVACGEKVRGDVIFEDILDRDMKAAFLLLGEDLVEFIMDEDTGFASWRESLVDLDKRDILSQVAGSDGLEVMGADNELAADAMYSVATAVSEYVEGQAFLAELMGKLTGDLGIDVVLARNNIIAGIKEAMATLDATHGVELVHFNAYVGRNILNPAMDSVIEIEAGETKVVDLSFAHPRYQFVGEVLSNFSLEQFDVAYEGEGVTAVLPKEIGKIELDATNAQPGDEITLYLYRGYDDEDNAGAHDAYRYVTTYTVEVTGEPPVVEDPYVTLEDVLDTTADGTITVKGETNLDYVTVAIVKNGETIYAVVYEKAEFEAGITLNAPDSAVEGDVYTVIVGTDEASDSDEFAIEGAVEEYEVVLNDVADTTADGTITVVGTTNLDYVTVAIIKNGETIYAVVYSKAEFEAGITLNAPDSAVEGDVYTVVVGTEKAAASDEFAIVDVIHEITLEDIADFKLSENENAEIVVKGTTTLDYVVVAVTLGADSIYAVTHTKAEYEAGIVIQIDGAAAGNVYTVAVGQDGTEAEDTFVILNEGEITLEDIVDFKLSENENAEITVKGTTTLDYVVVTVTLGADSIYAVTHTKAEYEAGIVIRLDGAVAGNVYTVAVGQEGTEAEDTFTILEETVTPVEPTLALAGQTTRTVNKGRTIDITTTPQNVPVGSTAEVVWTNADGEIVEITALSGDYNNIATVKGLKKGQTTLTATLYVDGVATDATVTVTVKVTTGGGGGGTAYTNVTVKVGETKDVVKAPAGGVNVEFTGSGDGEVKVEIVDGNVVVTGIKEGEVKGFLKVTNENGKTVLSGDYKFIVTDKGEVKHECEWPDIAATATKDAHWAHETIDIMTINGYIKGYEDGTFKPDQNITRAEFSAIVYRILGLQEAEDGVLYDDTVGHWAEDIIATMSLPEGYGMLRGYGDGNFGPNDLITREQAVAIIARAKSAVWTAAEEGAKDVFTDSEDISWWFDGEMDAAVTNGLITGYQDGSYKPLNYTTRAEACTLLARAWPEVLE